MMDAIASTINIIAAAALVSWIVWLMYETGEGE